MGVGSNGQRRGLRNRIAQEAAAKTRKQASKPQQKYNSPAQRVRLWNDLEKFEDHKAGRCDPPTCEYKHTRQERGLEP